MPVLIGPEGASAIVYSNETLGGYSERMLLSAMMLLEVPNGLDGRARRAHRTDGRWHARRQPVGCGPG